jgi:signal transduction histidine kinase/ligand-binding sensor domain-containing protein
MPPPSILPRLALLLLALMPTPAPAMPFPGPAHVPLHSHWLTDDGAPADIWGIAQSPDGYLWLGTGAGLFRFDGVAFRHVLPDVPSPETSNITTLAAFGDDRLWLGYYSGRIEVYEGGRSRVLPVHGAPSDLGMVRAMARTRDGVVWVATDKGVLRATGDRVTPLSREWRYPGAEAEFLVVDHEGTLWVATGHSLAFLREGERAFTELALPLVDDVAMTVAPDGRVWVSDARLGTFPLPADLARAPETELRVVPVEGTALFAKRLLFDASGHLWLTLASGRGGLARSAHAMSVPALVPLGEEALDARIDERHGLPSNVAVPLYESREGAVWVGSNAGLSQFRAGCFRSLEGLPDAPHGGFGLTVAGDGLVWASSAQRVLRADAGGEATPVAAWPTFRGAATGRDGISWFVGADGLWSDAGQGPAAASMPPGVTRTQIAAIAPDHRGGVYVGTHGRGIHHLRDGHWSRFGPADASVSHGAMEASDDGRLWVGRGGALEVYTGDGRLERVFGPADGLAIGVLSAINVGGEGVVVGGELGAALLDGERFVSMAATGHPAFGGVTGIVATPDQDIWLLGRRGLVHMRAAEIMALREGRAFPGGHRVYGRQDGLEGVALQSVLASTLRLDHVGRLWIATNRGISTATIDGLLQCGGKPGDATVTEVAADGVRLAPGAVMVTPPDPRALVIRYTVPSLAPPGRARFMIRMAGVDDAWRSVGDTREVTYASLAPGAYAFSVVSVGDDGEWSANVASQRIEVPPTFVESPLFRVGIVALLTLGLATAYRLQLRAMTARLRERLAVRSAERERIARELHDTLLQGVQGLILTIHAASLRVTDAGLRAELGRALDLAEDMLVEGRDRVQDLRVSGEARGDLTESLRHLGDDLSHVHGVPFRLVSLGVPGRLGPDVCDEAFRIAAEALRNAFAHARAALIEVEVAYSPEAVRLCVRDDGVGIDEEVVKRGRRPGHWGLAGMRERAAAAGGSLRVLSRVGAGTEVEIRLPWTPDSSKGRRGGQA